jgi:hypothetical protein
MITVEDILNIIKEEYKKIPECVESEKSGCWYKCSNCGQKDMIEKIQNRIIRFRRGK